MFSLTCQFSTPSINLTEIFVVVYCWRLVKRRRLHDLKLEYVKILEEFLFFKKKK